jgi:hypothetical protein
MLNELERLRDVPELCELLTHYAEAAASDRQAWQDRRAELGELGPRELVRLHGELLAYGWLEQNTGATPVLQGGPARQCYRVTPAGLRALKQARAEEVQPA